LTNTCTYFRWIAVAGLLVWFGPLAAPLPRARAAEPPQPSAVDQLALQQGTIADKYAKLEKLLQEMARIEGVSNPKRATLLMQAFKQSKENLTTVKLNSIVKLLSQEQLKRALENQHEARRDMQTLLELLLSENRSDRLKSEQERVREYLKEIERILRLQKGVQGRTEGGAPAGELAQDQAKVADRAGELAQKIQKNEDSRPTGDQKPQAEPNGQQPDDKGAGKDQPASPAEPQGQPAAGKDQAQAQPGAGKKQKPIEKPADSPQPGPNQDQPRGKSGKPSPGQKPGPPQGQAQGAPDGDHPPPAEKTEECGNPARRRVQAAEEKMRQAQKKLEDAQHKDAVEDQEQAKEELEKAKAELEKILRQLREEEVERVLAMLEGRFRKMLEKQLRIYEDTKTFDKVPQEERALKVNVPAGRLASDERKLVLEADKALDLLMEEGSSVAFPETVTQMRDDMQQVADRLDAANVGRITQSIEEDIIAALEEMIAALQKAQQDRDKRKDKPPPSQAQSQEEALVDSLSELRMIKALQLRVNTRTQRYSRLLSNADDPTGQATDQELRDALGKLAEKQERIYRITRDLVLGKNR
jgi:hypothetical protein